MSKSVKLKQDAPTLSELLVLQVQEAAPHLRSRRLRRGLAQGKWNGTPWQLRDCTATPEYFNLDSDETHGDLPTDFFQTCDEEYLEVSFSVDAKHFLSDAHRAFTAGLKKGRKEVNVKKLTPEERERIDAGKAKEISQWLKYKVVRAVPRSAAQGRVLMQMRWVLSFKADGTGKGRIVVCGY